MAKDAVHSTQYYIKCTCINKAILANLLRRPLKLGRLIVLRLKSSVPMATPSFPVPTHLISTWLRFSARKKLNDALTRANIFICLLDHAYETLFKLQIRKWNPKDVQKCLNIGEICNPVCCHSNRTVKLVFFSTFSRILLQRIKHFSVIQIGCILRYLF